MPTLPDPVRVSQDAFDEHCPTRADWESFYAWLDAEFGHYPDESPELDDFEPTAEDLAWLAGQSTGGCNPDQATPFDLDLLTISDRDWQTAGEPDDDADDDHPHNTFIGGCE